MLSLLIALAACSGGSDTKDATPTPEATADASKAPAKKEVPPPEDVAAAPSDAEKTASGLAYKVLTPGTGTEKPSPLSRVTLKMTVWTPDGKTVESTETRNRLANFAVRDAPTGFLKEMVPMLTSGQKVRVWAPAELGYNGQGGKPSGPVTAEVELASIVNPPAAPEDVAKPPADATTTASGLAYKVLKAGPESPDKPSKWARVTVNYTGWGPDGKVFDSTVTNGRPQLLKLNEKAMPGWVEGITQMKKGDKVRLWIPEGPLTQGGIGIPTGMLTYDIELSTFENPVPPPEDVAAPPATAKKTASGLAYRSLKAGSGKKPTGSSIVEVNYTGWTTDGSMFDTTTKRKKPMKFAATQVIPGWTEGLQLMKVGETMRFWIPEEIAYKGQPGKPAGMLVFDIELVSVADGPETPADLNTPAADGRKSPGGVTVKTLKAGTGADHPLDGAKVELQYSGWTAADGKMFDSTYVRGEPAKFPLGGAVPKGLVEGIQQMVVGEKARLWIPEELASSGRPGAPKGMLVFDVELTSFENPPPPIPVSY
ncbi:MAG: FKBP-type peptidyl-prolyl cis-trans isomerase, partial [Myxococcota bacterium]